MKAVLLAGGFGTRLSEETSVRPKPLVEIGGRPIIWHIMQTYAAHGIDDFVVCCGYRGDLLKEYFVNYCRWESDFTVDLGSGEVEIHRSPRESWRVTLVDTGLHTMTGGRVRHVRDLLDDTFFLTYGDGVADVSMSDLLAFHRRQDALVTLTAVQPPGRFGALTIAPDEDKITRFHEKPSSGDGGGEAWINGGYFVVEPSALDYVDGPDTVWEREPLERLASEGNLAAYRHAGFWHPMDTLRDKHQLEELWSGGSAPWTAAWPVPLQA
ncbi:glucose-1-phosphate cytidylyltransferase [Egicoccus halophilus]|uniref:Glucose-1-phosphate cytidylyltransferase n=1 Tax=Egicoccus halophilus TaxID=1670830 RepID=A0A8J3A762_9ACTN|nr:glucose-1-phosphate cytidylyltransferase [Egicoccus halophilus]GGI05366.1 glucose-1-phosphate cytidylyltransferase [Egicoccus halophilus]